MAQMARSRTTINFRIEITIRRAGPNPKVSNNTLDGNLPGLTKERSEMIIEEVDEQSSKEVAEIGIRRSRGMRDTTEPI